ncbi:HAD family phosphatase [Cesiribacter sp. SM1]|uniref:HAD family hydrolase n=1 Tax=Cesiribacter sp. SM1 TaxID=2861196 RepID=UPI001CD2F2EC|nr:HAD family phosphatase [Cesiribacter sp. SM1]
MISSSIQNIIFDLGGVVIHLDMPRTFAAFAQLGAITPEQANQLVHKDPLFLSYERGAVTPQEFLNGLRHLLGKPLSDEVLTEAWNAMLLDFPPENIELLRSLKKSGKYRLFMLSNTNIIHIEEVHRRLEAACGEKDFSRFFDKVYYSQNIGARKPDPEAYQVILDEWNLKPEETLFIDDNQGNLLGAEQLGIKTLHFQQNSSLPAIFNNGSGK